MMIRITTHTSLMSINADDSKRWTSLTQLDQHCKEHEQLPWIVMRGIACRLGSS
jgi:hypothetical protein